MTATPAISSTHARAGVECALARARVVSTLMPDELPLGMLVEASAEAAADVVMARHRGRLGVPEGLASLLVL
jgi:hypothetical protein